MGTKFSNRDRFVLARIPEYDISEAFFEVSEIRRQAEDRHHLGSDGNIETGFAHDAVVKSADARRYRSQGPVVHVNNSAPGYAAWVDIELILPVHVIVDER